jgi:hypothetical protein
VFAVYVLPNSTTDSTPPTITTRMPSSPLTPGWNSTDFDVNFTALDNVGGTGVESITYSAEGAQKVLPTTVSGGQASVRITEEGETVLTYSARDQAGNTSPEQERTVRLDKTEPYTTIESGPDGPTNDATPSFAFGGTDNLAPQEDIRYSYRLDDGGWSTYSRVANVTLGGEEGLQDGTHILYVRSMDLAGNEDSTTVERQFVVDTAPPSSSASTSPTPNEAGWHSEVGSVLVQFSAQDEGEAGIRGIIFSAPQVEEMPEGEFDGDSGWLYVREEGETGITYFAVDRAGNKGPEQTLTVKLDRTHPGGTITGPSSPTNDDTPTFDFAGTDNLSASGDLLFSYRLDDGGWSSFSAQTMATLGGEVGLADGSHTLYLRVRDLAGNVGGSLPQGFVVNTAAPDTKILSGPPSFTRSRTAVFDVAMSETGNAECRLDGARFGVCPPLGKYTDLADGDHLFVARARDAAGNVDPTPARAQWIVDTVPPGGSFLINGGAITTRTRMVELTLETQGASPASGVSGVRIRNAGGEWSAWKPYESSVS